MGWVFWRRQSPLPSIMAFKSTCILTKSKTFDPHEKCGTYVNKTILPASDVIRYVITITGLCISCWYQFRSGVPVSWHTDKPCKIG